MDTEMLKGKIAQYKSQQQEAGKRRAELERLLDNTEQQIIALGGAIAALEELIKEEEAATTKEPQPKEWKER